MRITSVSFRGNIAVGKKNIAGSQFQHVRVEATADVSEGESAHEVLAALKGFVAAELRIAREGDRRPVDGRFADLVDSE